MIMKNHVKKIVSIALCICMFIGMTWNGGGLEALATSIRGARAVTDELMNPKTNTSAPLGSEENPFTVLEIVPTLDQAQFGYFIPGCEPVDMDKVNLNYKTTQGLFAYNESLKGVFSVKSEDIYSFYEDIPENTPYYMYVGDAKDYHSKDFENGYLNSQDNENCWLFDSSKKVQGYFEKVEEGSGDFSVYKADWYPHNQIPQQYAVSLGYEPWTRLYMRYTPGKGNYTWTSTDEESDNSPNRIWMERTDRMVCHTKRFVNNDVFIGKVFGSQSYSETNPNGFHSKVITLTPEMLSDHMDLIDIADLIYLHNGRACSGLIQTYNFFNNNPDHKDWNNVNQTVTRFSDDGRDLTGEEALKIVRRMSSSNPAALIMDVCSLWDTSGSNNYLALNSYKLTLMTLMFEPAAFCEQFIDRVIVADNGKLYYDSDKVASEDLKMFWKNETFQYDPITGEDISDYARYWNINSGGYNLFDKIFTYQGDKSLLQELLFGGAISDTKKDDKKYSNNKNSAAFDYYESISGTRPSSLSNMDAVKFILQRPTSVFLPKLRILEVQPCDKFIYGSSGWKAYYQSLLPWYRPTDGETGWMENPHYLKVDTMPIWEFIGSTGTYDYDLGKNKLLTCDSSDDLISKYDLIIIGANQNETNGKNGYNDGNLKKYIYTSVGDWVATSEHKTDNQSKESVLITSGARYSPIDLTLKKLLELQDFADAGKPIVVDAKLYNDNGTAVDGNKIDTKSKMYEFLNRGESQKGIFVYNHINAVKMKAKLTESICRLEFAENGYPVEYVGKESSSKVLDGTYNPSSTLNYKFRIVADATASKDTTYTVSLNTDKNGDGVYGGSLKQTSEVKNMKAATKDDTIQDDKKEVAITSDKNLNIRSDSGSVENGKLKANTWYTISYTLPSNQKGIIPWKLEVASTANEKLRSSAIDYTLIPCSDKDKIRINVLQMNLTPEMTDAKYPGYSTFFTKHVVDIDRGNNETSYKSDYAYTEHNKDLSYALNLGQQNTVDKFIEYLEPVEEFNVNMQFMYNEDWKTMFATGNTETDKQNWSDFLGKYDMLIFGFQDVEMFTANEVFLDGLEDYIAQGKSVIFSHDMVQSWMTNGYHANFKNSDYSKANEWLRTVTGQRSVNYSLQSDGSYQSNDNKSEYCDNALQLMLRVCSDYSGQTSINPDTLSRDTGQYLSKLPKFDRTSELASSKNYRGWYSYSSSVGEGLLETSFVKIANNGQITTYPYNIPDEIEVLQTHVQNYALNLEYIEDGDVNVWYNLTDSSDEDVINSGLISNKANQTTKSGRIYNANDVYSAKDGDCRNNFYIYNKGNITYTGLGHGKSRESGYYAYMTDDEIKLFVNTMISAYRQPEGAPYAVVQNADATSGSSSIYYLDYDGDPNAIMDGKVVYENGVPCLKVQFKIEDDSTNPDADKKYYLYFLVDGDVKEYKVTGTGESLTVTDVDMKNASGANGKGYEVPKDYIGSEDNKITVYIPYTDITSRNGQISMSLCTYATYPKNGKTVSTPNAKAEVTTMYLPLFDLN